jgi:hypothetical protein
MASLSKKLAAEIALTAVLPFLAIWVYEISNMVAILVQGGQASLTVAGWIPVGVTGVSQGALSPLTKVVQILLATSLLAPLFALFSRAGFLVAKSFLLATAGTFVASTYWELLSQLTVEPMTVHVGIFLAGTAVLSFLLLRELAVPRNPRSSLPALSPQS